MARSNQTLLLAVALLGALIAVQAADLKRLQLLPELAGLSADALRAVQADTQCTTANPAGQTEVKNVCDGCKSVKPCVNAGALGWVAGAVQACPASTPWCNDGKCNATAPTGACNSAQPDTSFTCTSSGYFPNLSSCSKYWICIGTDSDPTSLKAYAGDCSAFSNAAYDPQTGLCVPKSQSTCSTVTCKAVGSQVYAPAPWLYVTCLSTNVSEALVVACKNKNQSLTNGVCTNACNSAGRFPWYDSNSDSSTENASFYECVQNGKSFGSPVKGTCPTGSTFDVTSSQCKASTVVPAELRTLDGERDMEGAVSAPTSNSTTTSTTERSATVDSTTTHYTSTTNPPAVCQKDHYCANSTHLRFCNFANGEWFAVQDIKCPARSPTCKDDMCTAPAPPSETSASFACSADGYFPDVSSCTRYFLCVNATAYVRDCSAFPNATYDPASTQCVVGRPCYTLDCRARDAPYPPYQLYAPAPWLYVVCQDQVAAHAVVLSCGRDEVYDGMRCAKACRRPGRFAYPGSSSKYWECAYLGNGTYSTPTPNECPGGSVFSGEGVSGRCAAKTEPPTTTVSPTPEQTTTIVPPYTEPPTSTEPPKPVQSTPTTTTESSGTGNKSSSSGAATTKSGAAS